MLKLSSNLLLPIKSLLNQGSCNKAIPKWCLPITYLSARQDIPLWEWSSFKLCVQQKKMNTVLAYILEWGFYKLHVTEIPLSKKISFDAKIAVKALLAQERLFLQFFLGIKKKQRNLMLTIFLYIWFNCSWFFFLFFFALKSYLWILEKLHFFCFINIEIQCLFFFNIMQSNKSLFCII